MNLRGGYSSFDCRSSDCRFKSPCFPVLYIIWDELLLNEYAILISTISSLILHVTTIIEIMTNCCFSLTGEKTGGKKSKVPVQLDIGNMLAALEKKQQTNKSMPDAKPVILSGELVDANYLLTLCSKT